MNKCRLIAKFSELYNTETIESLIHLCECGNQRDRIDVDALDVGVAGVDDDPMTLYLEYYD